MKKILTLLFSLAVPLAVVCQTAFTGYVSDAETNEPLLFASVALYQNGKLATGTETDWDGNFVIENLMLGDYEVEFSYVGYLSQKFEKVTIAKDKTTVFDADMKATIELKVIEIVVVYERPICKRAGCGHTCTPNCFSQATQSGKKTAPAPGIITQSSIPTVFPNPTSGIVNVTFSAFCEEMLIVDVVGKVWQRHVLLEKGTAGLDLSQLPDGTYFFTGKGFAKKVVVAH